MRRCRRNFTASGGGGIRTPVWFPTHRFRGGPVRPSPAPLLNHSRGERSPRTYHRGARIRTGDLCDPNAALYRTEPRPEIELRTWWDSTSRRPASQGARSLVAPQLSPRRDPGGSPRVRNPPQRTGWDSNPRGLSPTRFPIVRLKPLGHPSLICRSRSGAEKRREWDSNPRGLSPNALAGRRLKPLGHPSRKAKVRTPTPELPR